MVAPSILPPALTRFLVVVAAAVAVAAGAAAGAVIHPLVGFAAMAGIIGAVAVLIEPIVGLAAFIFVVTLLPFGVIPVPIGGVRLTFVDGLLTALLAVWLARLLTRRQVQLQTSPLDGPVLVFIGLAFVSYIFGIQSTTAEVSRFFLKTINSILFFFVVSNLVTTRPTLQLVVRCLILGALGAAILGIVLYLLPQDVTNRILASLRAIGYYPGGGVVTRTIAESQVVRAIGTSVDPNVLAGTFLLTVPYCVTQLFSARPVLPRLLLIPALALMLLCLVLTYSRGAYFGAVSATLLLAVLRYRKIWLLFILGAALLLTIPSGDLVIQRFESGVNFEDRAAQMRLGEYKDALRLIQAYPWFGVGFGASPDIDLYIAASSIYLLIAENMGLVGLTAFLVIAVVFYVHVLRAWRQAREPAIEAALLGALAAITAALAAGIFDHYFFNLYFPQTVALFWLNMAIAVCAARLGRQSSASFTRTGQ